MFVLSATLVAAAVAGFVGWGAAHRWPLADQQIEPETATAIALAVASAVVVIGVVLFGVLLFMVRTNTGFARLDLSAARFGANHATPLSTHVLRLLTQLGGAVVLVPLTALVALVLAGARLRERDAGTRHLRREIGMLLAFFVLTVGGQYLIVNVVKWLVDRARPNLDRLTGFSGPSFPSGHAAASAATFAAFALVLGRGRSAQSRSVLAGVGTALAVAIATSRVMLGVHWMTDVLAGLALGWAWFAVCAIAFGGRILRFAAPVVAADQDLRTSERGVAARC